MKSYLHVSRTCMNKKTGSTFLQKTPSCWEETFESFSVRGANLNPEDKEKYRKLSTDLSVLSLRFDQNALKDKNRYELLLTDEKDLSAFPKVFVKPQLSVPKKKGIRAGYLT